jgi:hypothetical protein
MIIKAKFTGKTSEDYKNGKIYELVIADYGGMTVRKVDKSGKTPYQSLSAFLRNWNKIEVLKAEKK